jgi:hypothetical protein
MEQTVFVSKRSKNGANGARGRVFSWRPHENRLFFVHLSLVISNMGW